MTRFLDKFAIVDLEHHRAHFAQQVQEVLDLALLDLELPKFDPHQLLAAIVR